MSPIGDWQTEARGTVRIARCGDALCGHALGSSSEKGEAILINMKAKGGRQWSGSVYSQGSGDTYYGTMAMKGTDTLRVEACALYHFYCSGNNWSRISRRADSPATTGAALVMQRTKTPGDIATGRFRLLLTEVLEHAEHNRADEGECNIRGYNAKSVHERTCEIHWERSLGFTSCRQITIEASKTFPTPKGRFPVRYAANAVAGSGNHGKKFVKSTC